MCQPVNPNLKHMENNELIKKESVNPYQEARRIYFMTEIGVRTEISFNGRACLYVIHKHHNKFLFKSKRNIKTGKIEIWREN